MVVSIWPRTAKIIIPIEAVVGLSLNIVLIVKLWRSTMYKSARVYRITCFIAAMIGVCTSSFALLEQVVPILFNDSAAIVLYGPVIFLLPEKAIDFLMVAYICQVHTTWLIIPPPSIVQLLSLAKPNSSGITRLIYAYFIPMIFYANAWYFDRAFIPDAKLKSELTKCLFEQYGTGPRYHHVYGVRVVNKNGIGMLDIMICDMATSHIVCYSIYIYTALKIRSRLRGVGSVSSSKSAEMQRRFFRNQIAQVLTTFFLLTVPIGIFTGATLFGAKLGNLSFVVIYIFYLTISATVKKTMESA